MLAEAITFIAKSVIGYFAKQGGELILKEFFDIHIGVTLTNKIANEYGNYRAKNPTDTITFEDFRDKVKGEAIEQLKNKSVNDGEFSAWYNYYTQNIAEQ
ncbi:hypothetical protein ABES03_08555 [Neobacillus rhizosphaerae]|uniref:hypothetical protein n=1 Tax=Neobacillus rhizosphaerae TaxID=2880965 RepID=UPI003D26FC43